MGNRLDRERDLKRLATEMCVMLPKDPDEARQVIALMTRWLDRFYDRKLPWSPVEPPQLSPVLDLNDMRVRVVGQIG
jgi:hypothetical protein